MEAYKVFYNFDGKLHSSNRGLNQSVFWQEYYTDKKNFPKFNFPIFAFDSLESAVYFRENECSERDENYAFEIWKICGETDFRIIDCLLYPWLYGSNTSCDIINKSLARLRDNSYGDLEVREKPKGTIGFSWIELVEKVK